MVRPQTDTVAPSCRPWQRALLCPCRLQQLYGAHNRYSGKPACLLGHIKGAFLHVMGLACTVISNKKLWSQSQSWIWLVQQHYPPLRLCIS